MPTLPAAFPLWAVGLLAAGLFGVGLVALLLRRHVVFTLLGLFFELLASALLFVAAGAARGDAAGAWMAALVLGLLAAHTAVGIAVFWALHRQQRMAHLDGARSLRG